METLKRIVSNQYFPAAAVLTAVVLFWAVGLLGGLSLLNNNQPPLTTLTWILFVYGAAVLTPLAGAWAAVDLFRRWQRNRAAQEADAFEADAFQEAPATDAFDAAPATDAFDVAPAMEAAQAEPAPEPEQAATAPVSTPVPVQQAMPGAPKKNAKQAGRKQAA